MTDQPLRTRRFKVGDCVRLVDDPDKRVYVVTDRRSRAQDEYVLRVLRKPPPVRRARDFELEPA